MYRYFNSTSGNEPRFIGMDFTFRNEEDVAVIDIDGTIGRDLLQEWLTGEKSENTGKEIKKKIQGITASKIIVNINSPGGDVNDGLYIHDLLAEHPAHVETVMRGFNASASTIIGQAGDTRKLSDNGLYLVHVPMLGVCAMLNKFDIELMERDLKTVENRIINIYEKRSKKNKDFKSLMEEAQGRGVWLEPSDALSYGLIDEIYEPTEETDETLSNQASMMNMLGIPMPGQNEINKEGLWKAIQDLQQKWENLNQSITIKGEDLVMVDNHKELHTEGASAQEATSKLMLTQIKNDNEIY